jgi:hypothetical protein
LVSFANLRKVSEAISCTPGCVSLMKSMSLLMTVLRKAQCPHRKLGKLPTTYMMSVAMNAFYDFPLACSHMFKSSLITLTTKAFSSSSGMQPEMLPRAQQSLLRRSMEKYSGFLMF